MTAWDDERVETVRRLAAEGYSQEKIAEVIGSNRTVVRHMCQKMGIKTNVPKIIDRIEPTVRKLCEEGCSQAEIAKKLGRDKGTIRRCIEKYGIEREPRPSNKKIEKAWLLGLTDKQICRRTGATPERVQCWRMTHNKPENQEYKPCKAHDCKYHVGENRWGFGCDYCSMTGRTRLAQLTPEERREYPCKLYEKGKKPVVDSNPVLLPGSIRFQK